MSGRQFSADLPERISAEARAHPEMSRSELSRRVCDWLDWRGPEGDAKEVSCRVALLKLHRPRLIDLPKPQGEVPRASQRMRGDEDFDPVDCPLAELGNLRVVLVTRFEREENKTKQAATTPVSYDVSSWGGYGAKAQARR